MCWDFDVIPNSYTPGCWCCEGNDPRVKCKGIKVEPYDWAQMKRCALRESDAPNSYRYPFFMGHINSGYARTRLWQEYNYPSLFS